MGTFKTADLGQIQEALKGKGIIHGFYQQAKLTRRFLVVFGEDQEDGFLFFLRFLPENPNVVPVVPEVQNFMNPRDGQGQEHKPCKDDGYAHHRDGPAVVSCDCF